MLVALTLAIAGQHPPPAPDGDRWAWRRVVHTISDELACEPNGTFAIALRWRFRRGVEDAAVRRHGKALALVETNKLISALSHATDLNYVQLSCLGKRDAVVSVNYVDENQGHLASMRLLVTIRSDHIELSPPLEVALPD